MEIIQEQIEVKRVLITFTEEEKITINKVLEKESEDSIIKCSITPETEFLLVSKNIIKFWDKIEFVLNNGDLSKKEKMLLIKISNTFSDYVQFPRG
jgi:hypothetical protein